MRRHLHTYSLWLIVYGIACLLMTLPANGADVSNLQTITPENVCELRMLQEIEGDKISTPIKVQYSPDDNYLGYVLLAEFGIWDIHNQQFIQRNPISAASQVAFGRDNQLALAANQKVYLWDDYTNPQAWRELRRDDNTHILGIQEIRFSAQTSELVMLSATDFHLYRWSIDSETMTLDIDELDGFDEVREVMLNNGSSVAALLHITNGDIAFINTTDGNLLGRFRSQLTSSSRTRLLAFLPNEDVLLVNKQDETGAFTSRLLLISTSGEIMQATDYRENTLWWAGAITNELGNITILSNPAANELSVFTDSYSQERCTLSPETQSTIASLTFNHSNTLLAIGAMDGTIQLWGIPESTDGD